MKVLFLLSLAAGFAILESEAGGNMACLLDQCGPPEGGWTKACRAFCVSGGYQGGSCNVTKTKSGVPSSGSCTCNGKGDPDKLIIDPFCDTMCSPTCTLCGFEALKGCEQIDNNKASTRCTCTSKREQRAIREIRRLI